MGSSVLTMIAMYLINDYYYGKVVGKLPFEPWSIVSSISHRGIKGDDMQEFGMTFLYFAANGAFRGMFSKILGNESPRVPVDYQTP